MRKWLVAYLIIGLAILAGILTHKYINPLTPTAKTMRHNNTAPSDRYVEIRCFSHWIEDEYNITDIDSLSNEEYDNYVLEYGDYYYGEFLSMYADVNYSHKYELELDKDKLARYKRTLKVMLTKDKDEVMYLTPFPYFK